MWVKWTWVSKGARVRRFRVSRCQGVGREGKFERKLGVRRGRGWGGRASEASRLVRRGRFQCGRVRLKQTVL